MTARRVAAAVYVLLILLCVLVAFTAATEIAAPVGRVLGDGRNRYSAALIILAGALSVAHTIGMLLRHFRLDALRRRARRLHWARLIGTCAMTAFVVPSVLGNLDLLNNHFNDTRPLISDPEVRVVQNAALCVAIACTLAAARGNAPHGKRVVAAEVCGCVVLTAAVVFLVGR